MDALAVELSENAFLTVLYACSSFFAAPLNGWKNSFCLTFCPLPFQAYFLVFLLFLEI